MVPNDWKTLSLGEITKEKISYGIVQAGPHVENGVPYIKSSNVGGEIKIEDLQRTSSEIHHKYRRSAVHPNDIVFSLRGNIGRTSIVPPELLEANLTQGTARISVNTKNETNFIYYSLASTPILNRINSLSKGSTFKEISLEELRKVKLPIPPLPEQQKIANILATWDKAISTTERLIENSTQQKKALMQQLLTGKKRLLNNEGKRFEGEWEDVKLGNICLKVTDGAHHSPQSVKIGYPMYSVKDMTSSGFRKNSARLISKDDFDKLVNQNCKPELNDILIAKDGSILKYCFVVKEKVEGVILSSIALLRPNLKKVFPEFIAQYFSQEYVRFFVGKALTSGSGVPRIVLKDFKGIQIALPSLKEQQKIATVLTNADKEIELLEQQLADLQQEKKALMQVLLTGKVRVLVEG